MGCYKGETGKNFRRFPPNICYSAPASIRQSADYLTYQHNEIDEWEETPAV